MAIMNDKLRKELDQLLEDYDTLSEIEFNNKYPEYNNEDKSNVDNQTEQPTTQQTSKDICKGSQTSQATQTPTTHPPHLQSKHETRVLSIALKRYDTSVGYWPYEALFKLSDLGIFSAIEYIEQLLNEAYSNIRKWNSGDLESVVELSTKHVSPRRIYESRELEDKYYHGIPNNISFQKLLARLQASTPMR